MTVICDNCGSDNVKECWVTPHNIDKPLISTMTSRSLNVKKEIKKPRTLTISSNVSISFPKDSIVISEEPQPFIQHVLHCNSCGYTIIQEIYKNDPINKWEMKKE